MVLNAYHLHKPDGSLSGYNACGECGQIALDANWDISVKCCTCYECGQPIPKEERNARGILYDRKCDKIVEARNTARMLDKAVLVPDYDGPVYFDGERGSYGDGYFENSQELAEHLETIDKEVPAFAFCCEEHPFSGPDLDQILENCVEEMDEDAMDRIDGRDDLQKAIDVFIKANAGLTSWYVDYHHKCRIPPTNTPSEDENTRDAIA